MRYFALWNGTAEAYAIGVLDPCQLPPVADGEAWHELDGDMAERTIAVVGGAVVPAARLSPEDSLVAARNARWEAAKTYKAMIVATGCATPKGVVQTDPDSQRIINGAATAALIAKQAGQPFSIDFTMADNSVVPHDADEMIALGLAVVAFLDACQRASTAIRDAIGGAATVEAVTAVDIAAGYPA